MIFATDGGGLVGLPLNEAQAQNGRYLVNLREAPTLLSGLLSPASRRFAGKSDGL